MPASSQYDPLIVAAARRYNVDPRLLRAVLMQESGLGVDIKASLPHDPDSPVGFAQMRPSTLRGLLGPDADPNDPATAINGAAAYLDQGMRTAEQAGYKNPGAFAAAHYFAGPDLNQWGAKTAQYVQDIAGRLQIAGNVPAPDPAQLPVGPRPVQLASAGVSDVPPAGGPPSAAGAPPGTGNLGAAMLNVPDFGQTGLALAMPPAAMPRPAPIAVPSQRALSDEEIARVGPEDVLGLVSRGDLTDADRMALQRRLEALSQGSAPGGQ